jgi:DUF1009 family protein
MIPEGALGIVCGGGVVPFAVAEAASRRGLRVVLFPLRGWANGPAVAAYPHHWIAIGQLDRFFRLANEEGCRDIVLVGTMVRPALSELKLDWGTLRRMPAILRAFRGGDDHLLGGLARILEGAGLCLRGLADVAPEIIATAGLLGRHAPDDQAGRDIDRGFALLAAMSPFDVGQAAVVAGGYVMAVEAAEGTDAMLERIAVLRETGRIRLKPGAGVLTKAPKRRQDRRLDLPSIGPDTVARVDAAGLAGIAVVAGATVLAEPQRIVEAADRAGLFVIACSDAEQCQ